MSRLIKALENYDEYGALCYISDGEDVHCTNKDKQTALHVASKHNLVCAVKLLLNKRADINVLDSLYNTPLMLSLKRASVECAEVLLNNEADINITDREGDSCLHIAAKHGLDCLVSFIITKTADVNAKNKHNETPIMYSIKNSHETTARILVEYGADVLLETRDKITVLDTVLQIPMDSLFRIILQKYKYSSIFENLSKQILQKKGFGEHSFYQITDADINTCLFDAVRFGDLEGVLFFLERGGDLNSKNKEGKSLVQHTIEQERLQITKLLVSRGAITDTTDNQGMSPLSHALNRYKDSSEYALLVIKGGLSTKTLNSSIKQFPFMVECTPLDFAIQRNCWNVVCALLECGATGYLPHFPPYSFHRSLIRSDESKRWNDLDGDLEFKGFTETDFYKDDRTMNEDIITTFSSDMDLITICSNLEESLYMRSLTKDVTWLLLHMIGKHGLGLAKQKRKDWFRSLEEEQIICRSCHDESFHHSEDCPVLEICRLCHGESFHHSEDCPVQVNFQFQDTETKHFYKRYRRSFIMLRFEKLREPDVQPSSVKKLDKDTYSRSSKIGDSEMDKIPIGTTTGEEQFEPYKISSSDKSLLEEDKEVEHMTMMVPDKCLKGHNDFAFTGRSPAAATEVTYSRYAYQGRQLLEKSYFKYLENMHLHNCVFQNDMKTLGLNLESRIITVDAMGDIGWTPLHFAIALQNYEAVKVLLKHGADINIRTRCIVPMFFIETLLHDDPVYNYFPFSLLSQYSYFGMKKGLTALQLATYKKCPQTIIQEIVNHQKITEDDVKSCLELSFGTQTERTILQCLCMKAKQRYNDLDIKVTVGYEMKPKLQRVLFGQSTKLHQRVEETFMSVKLIIQNPEMISRQIPIKQRPLSGDQSQICKSGISQVDDLLWENHSNLNAISAALVDDKPTLILSCEKKGFIPITDLPIKTHVSVNGDTLRVRVRNGSFRFGTAEVTVGTSVSIEGKMGFGTVGPMIELPDAKQKTAFVTCAHVFHSHQDLLQNNFVNVTAHVPSYKQFDKEQPMEVDTSSRRSATPVRRQVRGSVIKNVFTYHDLPKSTPSSQGKQQRVDVDAALVKMDDCLSSEGNIAAVLKSEKKAAGFDKDKPLLYRTGETLDTTQLQRLTVYKIGYRTGLTFGTPIFDGAQVKVTNDQSPEYAMGFSDNPSSKVIMKGQLMVESRKRQEFFKEGDSGSAVFAYTGCEHTAPTLKCIGMAIGRLDNTFQDTVVTPIADVLEALGKDYYGKGKHAYLTLKKFSSSDDEEISQIYDRCLSLK